MSLFRRKHRKRGLEEQSDVLKELEMFLQSTYLRAGTLPPADEFQNYWLGKRPHGPAILHSGLDWGKDRRCWMASDGRTLLYDRGGQIKYFDDPEKALGALRDYLRRRSEQEEEERL